MAMDKNWLKRHNAQTSRLNELVGSVIVANRNGLGRVMDAVMANKQSVKITALVKLLRERLKNRGDFGTYNACVEIVNLYLALKEKGLDEPAAKLRAILTEIEGRLSEYKAGARIDGADFAAEKLAAKNEHGSDMIGIEHLWAKAINEVLESI